MSKQLIVFEQGSLDTGDTGERGNSYAPPDGGAVSIKPYNNGETATENTFRRPVENIRQRTERLRDGTEELLYRVDNDAWFFSAGNAAGVGTSQAIPTVTSWDVSGGASDGTFAITDPMVVQGIATPDTDKQETVVYEFPAGAPAAFLTLDLVASKRAYNTANLLRVKWFSATEAELASAIVPNRCDVEITGDPIHILNITVEDTGLTQAVHLDTALNDAGVAADLLAMGFTQAVTGVNTTPILITDLGAPDNPEADYQLCKTYERNLYYIPVATFTDYFSANPGLQDGDTLAISFVDFETKRSICAYNSNTTVAASWLFNTRTYPELIANCIPLCKRIGTNLIWRDGTYVQEDQAANLVFGEHGRTVQRILDIATTINLAPYSTGSPLTVDPYSIVAAPLQSNLESMTDMLNSKPSIDANETVSGNWEFTGQFFVNQPAGSPISSMAEHQITHPAYATDATSKVFFDVTVGLDSAGETFYGIIGSRSFVTLSDNITVGPIVAVDAQCVLSQGTVGEANGLRVGVDTSSSALISSRIHGIDLNITLDSPQADVYGMSTNISIATGAVSVANLFGTDTVIGCGANVINYEGIKNRWYVTGTAAVAGYFKGTHNVIEMQASGGQHSMFNGFYGEHLEVSILKALDLGSGNFYGKLAEYVAGVDIGNDVYLNASIFTQGPYEVDGNVTGDYIEITQETGSLSSQVRGLDIQITAYDSEMYSFVCNAKAHGATTSKVTNIDASLIVDNTATIDLSSYGIDNAITVESGASVLSSANIYGTYNNIKFQTSAAAATQGNVAGTVNSVQLASTANTQNGNVIGTYNAINASTGTLNAMYGVRTTLDVPSGATVNAAERKVVGHYIDCTTPTGSVDVFNPIYVRASRVRNVIALESHSDEGSSARGNDIQLRASGGSGLATSTESISGTILGRISFWGCDASDAWYETGLITCQQDGASTTNHVASTLNMQVHDNTGVSTSLALDSTNQNCVISSGLRLERDEVPTDTNPNSLGAVILDLNQSTTAALTSIGAPATGKVVIVLNDSAGSIAYTAGTNPGEFALSGSISSKTARMFVCNDDDIWFPVT